MNLMSTGKDGAVGQIPRLIFGAYILCGTTLICLGSWNHGFSLAQVRG